MARTKMTFEQWYEMVDKFVKQIAGLGRDDLEDCTYRDWYDDGVTPKRAAARAIKNSMDY